MLGRNKAEECTHTVVQRRSSSAYNYDWTSYSFWFQNMYTGSFQSLPAVCKQLLLQSLRATKWVSYAKICWVTSFDVVGLQISRECWLLENLPDKLLKERRKRGAIDQEYSLFYASPILEPTRYSRDSCWWLHWNWKWDFVELSMVTQ